MIKSEENKIKLYINIALLIISFCIFAFFFFPKFFSSSSENSANLEKINQNMLVKKYSNIKSIKTDIFTDERFRALKNPITETYSKPKVGNLEPFKPK